MGVPSAYELVLATKPYYRSTYVFLYPKAKGFEIHSLDDPILRRTKIGVHVIGDDYANPPPAHALASRRIITNVVGYRIYGDYLAENPPARLVDAVGSGDIDVAIVWAPFAGYFAKRQAVALEMVPVPPSFDDPHLPFVFAISNGCAEGRSGAQD
jgi:mxaJ protein